MKITLAADHRGLKLKNAIGDFLKSKGYDVVDVGTYSNDSCDYTDYVLPAAKAVGLRKVDRAILFCYTGIGSCIAANKVKGVRAALANDIKRAVLSRRHNDSNILVLAAGFIKQEYAKKVVMRWLSAAFDGGRHARRVKKIKTFEAKHV